MNKQEIIEGVKRKGSPTKHGEEDKVKESQAIEQQTQEFIDAGNKITELPDYDAGMQS